VRLRVSPVAGVRDLLAALLGVSAYSPSKGYGPELDDKSVVSIREALGGQIQQAPTTRVRWYSDELETAQITADAGDLMPAAQLYRAMRRDGVISGILATLSAGLVRLPKKYFGDVRSVEALRARNGSRSVFDDMCPPSELKLINDDGEMLGVSCAELVPVPGRDFPVAVRLEPEFLRYRWVENRWYFTSVAGLLPITPGDGQWVLHTPGGRMAPWLSGKWPSTGRSFINKEHAYQYRSTYCATLANPARVAYSPLGSTESQRRGFFAQLMAWGVNNVFDLPPGWEVKLLEVKGEGHKVFQDQIDTADREIAIALAGQVVTVDGGSGFSNSDVHRAIRSDIIQAAGDALAYTINTQIIPPWVAKRWGVGAIAKGAVMSWDVKRPKDLKAEADAMKSCAEAVVALREALAPLGLDINVGELLASYGIPSRKAGELAPVAVDGAMGEDEFSSPAANDTLEAARRAMPKGDPGPWDDWRRRNPISAAERDAIEAARAAHARTAA
jgi:hypothetical protein